MFEIVKKPNYLDNRIYNMCVEVLKNVNTKGRIIINVDRTFLEQIRKMVIDCSTGDKEWCFNELGLHDFKIDDEKGIAIFKLFLANVTVDFKSGNVTLEFPLGDKVAPCVWFSSLNVFLQTIIKSGSRFKVLKVEVPDNRDGMFIKFALGQLTRS